MASEINEIVRQRRSVLLALKRAMHDLDAVQEASQRRVLALLQNRRKIPTREDLTYLINGAKLLGQFYNAYSKALQDASTAFAF